MCYSHSRIWNKFKSYLCFVAISSLCAIVSYLSKNTLAKILVRNVFCYGADSNLATPLWFIQNNFELNYYMICKFEFEWFEAFAFSNFYRII